MVALLFVGSAILLYSCAEESEESPLWQDETMMTDMGENLTVVMSRNGRMSHHFTTPLMEVYSLAKDPYREFRKGVKIITYKDDSVSSVDATLTANYAIYYINRDLWEAKGNVVAENSNGRTLYTQQLFWNAKTRRIYSNVDSKIVQKEGREVIYGEGFESDEQMNDWRVRRMMGRMEFEMRNRADSSSADSVAAQPVRRGRAPAKSSSTGKDAPREERQITSFPRNMQAPGQPGRPTPNGQPRGGYTRPGSNRSAAEASAAQSAGRTDATMPSGRQGVNDGSALKK